MKLLTPMQTRDQRHRIAPTTARIRRITLIAATQPIQEIIEVRELPRELERKRAGDAPPHVTHEEPDQSPDTGHEQNTPEGKPPVFERIPEQRHSAWVEKR